MGYSNKGEEMKEKLINLIDIKTIVTFVITAIFAILALKGRIETDVVMQIVTMVMAFYFGTQYQKNATVTDEETEEGDE
jgi:5-bromo-4-chloroindolyl phosphate hydrolysis protein